MYGTILAIMRDDYEWLIQTTHGKLRVTIDDQQQCCEDFGIGELESQDDVPYFLAADLLKIEITDPELLVREIWEEEEPFEPGMAIFVTFLTTKGPLQIVVYNRHNGYYGHAVKIWWEQGDVLFDDTF